MNIDQSVYFTGFLDVEKFCLACNYLCLLLLSMFYCTINKIKAVNAVDVLYRAEQTAGVEVLRTGFFLLIYRAPDGGGGV